jgi:hypothetical protein
MSANVDAMLRAAIDAVRKNQKADARALLERILDIDERNEQAWMWLSATVDTDDEKRICLDNVLIINPNNDKAKAALKALGGAAPARPAPAPEPDDLPHAPAFEMDAVEDLFAATSFETSPAASDWDIPTSSPSSTFAGPSVSDQDLDDWISGMNIGKTGGPTATANTAFASLDDDFLDDSPAPSTPAAFAADPFGSAAPAADPFGSDPFGAEAFGDTFNSTSAFNEDDFDSFAERATSTPATRSYSPASRIPAEDFDEVISKPVAEDFDDLFADEPGTATRSGSGEALSPEEYFAQIPDEIPAGRMPGVDESPPTGARIGLVIAVVLNFAALGLLAVRAMG